MQAETAAIDAVFRATGLTKSYAMGTSVVHALRGSARRSSSRADRALRDPGPRRAIPAHRSACQGRVRDKAPATSISVASPPKNIQGCSPT